MYGYDPERNQNEHTCETRARNYDHQCLKIIFLVLLILWEICAVASIGFLILSIILLIENKNKPDVDKSLMTLAIIECACRLAIAIFWTFSISLALYGIFTKSLAKFRLAIKLMIASVALFLIVGAIFSILVSNYPYLIGTTVGYSILLVLVIVLGKKNCEAMARCEICY